jgi:hypothetical protein
MYRKDIKICFVLVIFLLIAILSSSIILGGKMYSDTRIKNVGRPSKKNLFIQNNTTNPNYQIDINADYLQVQSIALADIDLTVDITASGVNGLDTGSEASDTWYSIWVIYNPTTNTISGLLSTSTNSPTLPAGYTKSRRIGWIRNNNSSNFMLIYQSGNWCWYNERHIVLTSDPAATSWTDVDCSGVLPPTARNICISIQLATIATGSAQLKLRSNDSTGDFQIFLITGTNMISGYSAVMQCDTNQIIEYIVTRADEAIRIDITGWEESE